MWEQTSQPWRGCAHPLKRRYACPPFLHLSTSQPAFLHLSPSQNASCLRRADSSMTEESLDAAKLDYIANRSDRGREAVEKLYKERQEKLLRMSGRKDNNPNLPASNERQV